MFIIAIILTLLGLKVFQWAYVEEFIPTWSNRPVGEPIVIIGINLLWLALLGSGLYLFWKVSYLIPLLIMGVFLLIPIAKLFLDQTKKMAAINILNMYKQIKQNQPALEEKEVLKNTAEMYFQKIRKWDKYKIDCALIGLKYDDIKSLVGSILYTENAALREVMDETMHTNHQHSYRKRVRKMEKINAIVEEAYKAVFEKKVS